MTVTILDFTQAKVFQLEIPQIIINAIHKDNISLTEPVEDWLTSICDFNLNSIEYMIHEDVTIYDESNL
jgi:hypothetical protein